MDSSVSASLKNPIAQNDLELKSWPSFCPVSSILYMIKDKCWEVTMFNQLTHYYIKAYFCTSYYILSDCFVVKSISVSMAKVWRKRQKNRSFKSWNFGGKLQWDIKLKHWAPSCFVVLGYLLSSLSELCDWGYRFECF
jgi:hypothetical protein